VPETAAFMVEQMPRAHLLRLEPAGHMSVFERHDSLGSELAAFSEEIFGEHTMEEDRARAFVVEDPAPYPR